MRGARKGKRARDAGYKYYSCAYWQRICPMMHIENEAFVHSQRPPAELSAARLATLQAQLVCDGFFTLEPAELQWPLALSSLTTAVAAVKARGWPATMALVYDEAWAVVHYLSSLMAAVSGNSTNCLDVLLWSVDASSGQAGFAPHRDRQPGDVPGSFRADGTPKYHTAWIALSDATVHNSCLYVIPAKHDPGYLRGDSQADDPLHTALKSDSAVQAIRAVPLDAGGALIFSHRLMHWGSRGSASCAEPRVSLSFGCSGSGFEPAYLRCPSFHLPFPKLAIRLALAAAQLINYHERFDFSGSMLVLFGRIFERRKTSFTQTYRQKTAHELKSACEDRRAAGDEALDSAIEGALDAMLDEQMEAGGYLYHDDFDELD